MATFLTNRGAFQIWKTFFQGAAAPTQFNLALCTDAVTPTRETNLFSELTEIPAGNGYTSGGLAVARNSTDFDVVTEDDVNNRAYFQMKAFVWTASGGNLPASGTGARWAVLLDNNATIANREVLAVFDLVANRVVSVGQTLTIDNAELRHEPQAS